MAGSMDLEARLRALRSSKRPPAPSPAPSSTPVSALTFTDSISKVSPVQKQMCVTIAGRDGYPSIHSSSSIIPPLTAMHCCSSNDSACFAPIVTSVAPLRASELAPAHEKGLQLTTAQLGPEYEKAVKVAQFAIDRERRQMPHTAIDAYIQAGQMLIEIGRRQAAPHLQEIVKTKALALLQRAEGLSEWTNEVLAKDSSQQAVAVAYHQSQQNRNKSLMEKQELVSKMQQDNRNMKERLNQLALLTKIRGRMVKVVRTRRARKAAEKEETEAAVQASTRSSRGGFNDVTGEVNEYLYSEGEGSHGGLNNVTGSSSDEDEEPRNSYQHFRTHHASATGDSPREAQKVGLINELHERIGLPQIDQFRKFEPLTNDPRTDEKQEQLQSELEVAKQEADKLRAAVQEMERCLQLAAQHSKQRSIKLEQQKAQEFAEVQSELDRVREELETERRRSTSSLHSGPSSWRSSVASDPGGGETKNTGKLGHVRSSLVKVFRGRDEQPGGVDNVHSRRASVQRTWHSHDSPRHTPTRQEHSSTAQSYDMDEEETEEDDDGGVWL